MAISASALQTPLTNLLISLAFGAGQVIIGAAMLLFSLHKGRWRQIALFGLALIGAWFACSGLTELIVSGAEMLARTGNALSAESATHIHMQADQGFLIASIILLVLGVLYPLLTRFRRTLRTTNTSTSATHPGSQPSLDKQAEDRAKPAS